MIDIALKDDTNTNELSYSEKFAASAKAFARETTVALLLKPSDADRKDGLAVRAESPRGYIIKMLLYIGLLPRNASFAALARLVEVLAFRPELSLEEVIDDFARTHNSTSVAVSKIIDKSFNVYDPIFIDRVATITQSQPMTAKDVLCDLAATIRAEYYSQGHPNE